MQKVYKKFTKTIQTKNIIKIIVLSHFKTDKLQMRTNYSTICIQFIRFVFGTFGLPITFLR